MGSISLKNINYSYDETKIFSNLNLEIKDKGITTLIGANGSGKSTLLKLIANIIKETSGEIILDGKNIKKLSRKKFAKNLAFLPQTGITPDYLTVREYIALSRFCHHSWFSKLKSNDFILIEKAIEITKLKEYADTKLGKLSQGIQQRALIALAVAQDTKYILFDEPMNNLDIKQQDNILKIMYKLSTIQNKKIIVILHDLTQIRKASDQVIVLKNGEIIANGAPEQALNRNSILQAFDFDTEDD